MNPVYRVAKWRETYETADSRKHKSLAWISMPLGFQSNGYQLLIDQQPVDAPAIYGAWCATVKVAAECEDRGVLANSRGEGFTAERIARLAYMPPEPFRKMLEWASSESVGWLEVVTQDVNGEWVTAEHNRSPIDRQSIDNQSATDNDRSTTALHNKTLHNTTEQDREAIASCGEPASPAFPPPFDPVAMEFPTNGKGTPVYRLTESKVAEYAEAFPGVDVRSELLKARQWCRDNPTKRKTPQGILSFLTRWLGKVQNAGGSQRGSPPPPSAESRTSRYLPQRS